MMQGHVDVTYQTLQRDMFASGIAAQIGTNAFVVWLAIKSHADFNTGEAWPGMRRLGALTGLSLGTISNCVRTLVAAKLLRILNISKGKSRRGNTYVARERMDVRLGERVLCTLVIDYVPASILERLQDVNRAVKTGKGVKEVFAQCELIPGKGFTWDPDSGSLRANVPARELPLSEDDREAKLKAPLADRVRAISLAIQRRRRRTLAQ